MPLDPKAHQASLPLQGVLAVVVLVSLTSCEAMRENWARNAAFNNSPQGLAMTLQAIQYQQMLNQQSYQFEQSLLLQQQQMHMEMARSMQPVRVQYSGSIHVQHSGTIRVRQ